MHISATAKRFLLGIGLALSVGGWATSRYADEQQQSIPREHGLRLKLWGSKVMLQPSVAAPTRNSLSWRDNFTLMPSSVIYRNGVIAMACGASVLGFVFADTLKIVRPKQS